jgi:hypothetical protein
MPEEAPVNELILVQNKKNLALFDSKKLIFKLCRLASTNPSSTNNTLIRHKEWNEQQHRVPKVPFNKDLNRNTPSRAVLGGVFCVRGVAFKAYDVRCMVLVVTIFLFVFSLFFFHSVSQL